MSGAAVATLIVLGSGWYLWLKRGGAVKAQTKRDAATEAAAAVSDASPALAAHGAQP